MIGTSEDHQTFEEIWEQDARWMTGPHILGEIVNFLRDRSIVVEPDETDRSRLTVHVPLPEVRNEINGKMVPIFWMVPEELRGIFLAKCDEIAMARWLDVEEVAPAYLRQALTQSTIISMNSALRAKEMERMARGEDGLWVVAAKTFGIFPCIVPFVKIAW